MHNSSEEFIIAATRPNNYSAPGFPPLSKWGKKEVEQFRKYILSEVK